MTKSPRYNKTSRPNNNPQTTNHQYFRIQTLGIASQQVFFFKPLFYSKSLSTPILYLQQASIYSKPLSVRPHTDIENHSSAGLVVQVSICTFNSSRWYLSCISMLTDIWKRWLCLLYSRGSRNTL